VLVIFFLSEYDLCFCVSENYFVIILFVFLTSTYDGGLKSFLIKKDQIYLNFNTCPMPMMTVKET